MARGIPRPPVAAGVLAALALIAQTSGPGLTPEQQAVAGRISADSLRGHVSFLASDLLEGRATPSRGLDLAAEYIAAQFRRAGLEPAGGNGYFQTTTLTVREPNPAGFAAALSFPGGRTQSLTPEQVLLLPNAPFSVENARLMVVEESSNVDPAEANGAVVLVESPRAARKLEGTKPALTLRVVQSLPGPQVGAPPPERIGYATASLMQSLRSVAGARVTMRVAQAVERSVPVHNVAGLLRGSDPQLRDTYVILSSHYDHVGVATAPAADSIFNGANDDASGTSSMMEVAGALASLPVRPKRSVLFVAFFGEERGMLGSRYYAQHPLAPPAKTVAALNLEQLGRTDTDEGPQVRTASVTGFDFSDLPAMLVEPARLAGIRVFKDPQASDAYFNRSDNRPLAELGIPAHTLSVAYGFPDYHKVTDSWEKLDYENMAAVNRAVALGLLRLASDAPPPKWNPSYKPGVGPGF